MWPDWRLVRILAVQNQPGVEGVEAAVHPRTRCGLHAGADDYDIYDEKFDDDLVRVDHRRRSGWSPPYETAGTVGSASRFVCREPPSLGTCARG